jgi:hypothetical protein
LLSVLAWAFFNKNHFTVFNAELIKRFHRVRTAFLVNFYCLDKIYNLFYALPFFDLVFSVLLNRCSNYFNQQQLFFQCVPFQMCSYLFLCIYPKLPFHCVDILWHNVQTGDSQNLNASSVYCRSCLKHT